MIKEYRNEKMLELCLIFEETGHRNPFAISSKDRELLKNQRDLSELKKSVRLIRLPVFLLKLRERKTDKHLHKDDREKVLRLCLEIQRYLIATEDYKKRYFLFSKAADMKVICSMSPETLEDALTDGTVYLKPVCDFSKIRAEGINEWIQARANARKIKEKS